MNRRSLIIVSTIALSILGINIAGAQLGLRNDGIEFPDGTVQMSAAETPGQFVQASASMLIMDMGECATGNVYTVPAGKRLRIEWISIELADMSGGDYDPVDIDIMTWLGGVQASHFLDRIDGAIVVGTSFFKTVRWSSPITLYNQGNKTIEMRACRDNSTNETQVTLTFHGQLFAE